MSEAVDIDGVLGDDWHPMYSAPVWLCTDEPCECGAQWKPAPEHGEGAREMTHTEACEYMAWANAEEAFYNREWEIDDADVDAYLAYCSACFAEELDIHTPQQWRIHNRPTGPLG
jgi:hypothetical protein